MTELVVFGGRGATTRRSMREPDLPDPAFSGCRGAPPFRYRLAATATANRAGSASQRLVARAANKPPAAMATTFVLPSARPTGTLVCPQALSPQATTLPLLRRAREWVRPAEIAIASLRPFGTVA